MTYPNIGWLFYKDYYRELTQFSDEQTYKQKSDNITNSIFHSAANGLPESKAFYLKTIYPGLLPGSGYSHNSPGNDVFKVGFHFDYTTGLPCIPGSSVKGLLRSVFPFKLKKISESEKNARIDYLIGVIKKVTDIEIDKTQLKNLEKEIFDGQVNHPDKTKPLSIYKRDLFFDSFPVGTLNKDKLFLASDFITHHEDPLKDPNPVMFLKVLPEVIFQFSFKTLKSAVLPALTAEKKREFFREILLDFGIGAKTNVGYGQFEECSKEELEKAKHIRKEVGMEQAQNKKFTIKTNDNNATAKNNFTTDKNIKVGDTIKAKFKGTTEFVGKEKEPGQAMYKFEYEHKPLYLAREASKTNYERDKNYDLKVVSLTKRGNVDEVQAK